MLLFSHLILRSEEKGAEKNMILCFFHIFESSFSHGCWQYSLSSSSSFLRDRSPKTLVKMVWFGCSFFFILILLSWSRLWRFFLLCRQTKTCCLPNIKVNHTFYHHRQPQDDNWWKVIKIHKTQHIPTHALTHTHTHHYDEGKGEPTLQNKLKRKKKRWKNSQQQQLHACRSIYTKIIIPPIREIIIININMCNTNAVWNLLVASTS